MACIIPSPNYWLMKIQFIFFISGLWTSSLVAQQEILLQNPSFEQDFPQAGVTPTGWINMGPETESPPDIQPGAFEVRMKAQAGKQYVGLVVRDNGTWEGIGQKLKEPLQKDSTYQFSLWLARAPLMMSLSRQTQKPANYNAPTILRIWGVNSKTGQTEMLGETEPVSPSVWMLYTFELKPQVDDFYEIELMAWYAPGHKKENGNLLIDNCSPITKKK